MTIREYYKNKFREDLVAFMPDSHVPYFGHNWGCDCGGLNKIPIASRPSFLICLYFTVLVDQAMYAHFQDAYNQFEQLTRHPKFCHGLGQFQKNPREILSVPIENGMVNTQEIEQALSAGMELFINEVVDFFQQNMPNIIPNDFFRKLIYDPNVQIPSLVVMINPEMKENIVVKAYEALRGAVEKILKTKG
jgi:hypothetical protein